MKNTIKGVMAAALALSFAACASEPPKPAVHEELVQKSAKVMAVDQASRLVTIQAEDGSAVTLKVSDEVKNLPQVKEGDTVTVSYYQAIAAEVKKPGEGVEGVQTDAAAVKAQPGSMPAAGAGVLMRTTVVVDAVDTKNNMVTFTRSDGEQRTVEVVTPEGQTFIKGLKKGDHVEVAYTEAVAVEVKPTGG